MAESMTALADALEQTIGAQGTPERAEKEQAYLKSALTHLGASVPAIRRAVREAKRARPDLPRRQVLALARALWKKPVHERRMAAVEVLDAYGDRLEAQDLALVERFLREAKTWALVDGLAASVAGALVERFPALASELDRWAEDRDFWIRRSALLARLVPLRQGRGDFEAFARHADAMLEEREFFIRKAIGWVLRDTSKKRPGLVDAWLAPRAARASRLTVREATKHLPEDRRRAILAANGAVRPAAPPAPAPRR